MSYQNVRCLYLFSISHNDRVYAYLAICGSFTVAKRRSESGSKDTKLSISSQVRIDVCYGFGCSLFSFSNTNFQNTNKIMNLSELRIGNFITDIWCDTLNFRITSLGKQICTYRKNQEFRCKYEKLKPIIITEELLLKIKFSHKSDKGIYVVAPFGFEFHFEKYGSDYVLSVYCSTGVFVPNDIKFIHQLQNLWFSIFGEELLFSTEP